jgi:hypothetical protein
MQRNATQSPLLRLPAELRNKIFKLAVGGHTIHLYHTSTLFHTSVTDLKILYRDRHCFALLSVCRQIYLETALLPFSANTLSFHNKVCSTLFMKQRLPIEREAISCVKVHLTLDTIPDLSTFNIPWSSALPNLTRLELCFGLGTPCQNSRFGEGFGDFIEGQWLQNKLKEFLALKEGIESRVPRVQVSLKQDLSP